ncbi:MAG: rubrerythrin family protein [Candidatus Bathyarchaeota archaeon]|nr:rubrerythrin family protein [Candidatus Bathyarchaeota archaeon]
MSKTDQNLEDAFAGESQANRKYLFFAEKADSEGQRQIARLFRATAEAETVHARNHLKVMNGIKSTKDNLSAAISGENHEFTEMYPGFIKQAVAEGNDKAKNSFDLANKVEQIHAGLYQKAIDALKNKKEIAKVDYYVCSVCGNTVEGSAPGRCPICGSPKEKFFKPA